MASRSSNTAAVPEAKGALDRFKMEVAQELGVPLTDGYNGNLTSKQNGSVGGYMVKKMIEAQERQMSGEMCIRDSRKACGCIDSSLRQFVFHFSTHYFSPALCVSFSSVRFTIMIKKNRMTPVANSISCCRPDE